MALDSSFQKKKRYYKASTLTHSQAKKLCLYENITATATAKIEGVNHNTFNRYFCLNTARNIC